MTEHEDGIEQPHLDAAPPPLWVTAQDGRLVNLAYCTDVQVEAKPHGFPGRPWRIVGRPGGRHTTTLADFDTEQTARAALGRLAAAVSAIVLDS